MPSFIWKHNIGSLIKTRKHVLRYLNYDHNLVRSELQKEADDAQVMYPARLILLKKENNLRKDLGRLVFKVSFNFLFCSRR